MGKFRRGKMGLTNQPLSSHDLEKTLIEPRRTPLLLTSLPEKGKEAKRKEKEKHKEEKGNKEKFKDKRGGEKGLNFQGEGGELLLCYCQIPHLIV